MYSKIQETIKQISSIPIGVERKQILQPLIDYIQVKVNNQEAIRLNFICTHNSRRSYLGQIWAQTLAYHFNIPALYCYSGGTEATALYPTVINTLENIGFTFIQLSIGNNPNYAVKFSENEPPIIVFSKKWNHPFNPNFEFAAILTCSEADQECPYISGAEKRFAITYQDPKVADNTSHEMIKYQERTLQIASEMYYVFSQIKNNKIIF